MSTPVEQITGLVLAGGRGTRMGGADKGLASFHGEPLVSRAMRRLQPQVGFVMINANRHLEQYATLGAAVVPDTFTGFAGPLAGLHAGLARCSTEFLAAVPCDTPMFPTDLVHRLWIALEDSGSMTAIAVTDTPDGEQRHPVFCLLRRSALPSLDDYLKRGGRKVSEWLDVIGCARAHFDDEAAFTNLNTRDELDAFARRLS
jgi:molybdopterin-guanine dinucleotide biosynthesis protein A